MKYFSDEYFKEVEQRLIADSKWQQDTKGVKTSVLFGATDKASFYVLKVEEGVTSIVRVEPGTTAEFSFEGPYDVWTKVAKGEMDFQAAVLKGHLKFKGSITKILFYKDRFARIADVIKSVPADYDAVTKT